MTANISDVPTDKLPISEHYRRVAKLWVDAENAAKLLEETKSVSLEERKTKLIEGEPGLSEAKAERLAKSSKEWREFIVSMCQARGRANLLKVQLRYIEMQHKEWIAHDANARQTHRMAGHET